MENQKIIAELTPYNAHDASLVINRQNPDWGTWKFNYKGQPLNDGEFTHTIGTGSNSKVLHEGEFKFWGIVSFKDSLGHIKQLARNSYRHISQDPDKRADSVIRDYSEEMDTDLAHFQGMGADQESLDRYKEGYIKMISTWLHSQSNCASSFVCGPANFPVAKMQKRNRWADNHYNAFREWRDKVHASYKKRAKKDAVIAGGGELEITKKKLADLEKTQEYMKAVNAAHRAFKKDPASLDKTDFSDDTKKFIRNYVPEYSFRSKPFTYELSNNNANIRNTKERIAILEAKEKATTEGLKEIPFEGGKVILNVEVDRLQIHHDAIPAQEVRESLRKNGFKWSPFYKVWQRQLTDNAKIATQRLLNIQIA